MILLAKVISWLTLFFFSIFDSNITYFRYVFRSAVIAQGKAIYVTFNTSQIERKLQTVQRRYLNNKANTAIVPHPINLQSNSVLRFVYGGKDEAAEMRGDHLDHNVYACVQHRFWCQALRPMGYADWGWLNSSWRSAMYSFDKTILFHQNPFQRTCASRQPYWQV